MPRDWDRKNQGSQTMQDYLKTIRLGYGKGEPGKQACWMSALSSHIGGEWTDKCNCVDPSINTLCIQINDLYSDHNQDRTEDILEFGLFEPLGTLDPDNIDKRFFYLVDRAVRYWLPLASQNATADCKCEICEACKRFEKLDPITNDYKMADASNVLQSINSLLDAAIMVTRYATVPRKKYEYECDYNAYYAARVACVVAGDSIFGDSVAARPYDKRRVFIKQHIFPVLRQLIDMGKHGPYEQEPVCGVEKFKELVGIK